MTSTINQTQAMTAVPPRQSSPPPAQREHFQQTFLDRRSAEISITTDEGDVVTLSSASRFIQTASADAFLSPDSRGNSITAAGLEAHALTISVTGDLNSEELSDITRLMDKLTAIAENFFNRNYGEALDGAMGLGDLGSLARLSASFSSRTVLATQYRFEEHPLPALAPGENPPPRPFETMAGLPDKEVPDNTDLLAARWQQIREAIDQRAERLPPPERTTQKPRRTNPVDDMLETARETISRHPRLAPLIFPAAEHAIDQGAAPDRAAPVTVTARRNSLRLAFFHRLQGWFNAG